MNQTDLDLEKKNYFLATSGGISLQASGAIYWLTLGIAGFFLSQNHWAILGFITSGLIFPIGLLLSKPLKSNLMLKRPLSSLVMPAMTAMFLTWPMIITGYFSDVAVVPLFLAIGMSLHWPAIGWMYNSKSCMIHAIFRVAIVTGLWFTLPGYRFTIIPLTVSIIYLLTIFSVRNELRKATTVAN